eukprot:1125082-Prymnesium_polylepis.1
MWPRTCGLAHVTSHTWPRTRGLTHVASHTWPHTRGGLTSVAALLEYLEDDGQSIEPKYYVPILPMVLVNGAEGIGTG